MKKTTSEKYPPAKAFARSNRSLQTVLVPISQMRINKLAQRELRPSFVEQLYADFDPDMFGTPEVSFREGYYYVVDGQHRIEAAKKYLGIWEEQSVECWVWEGLTAKDEAKLFLKLNNRLTVHAFDKIMAAVHAGDPTAVAIYQIVESLDLHIARNKGQNSVSAVGALQRVYSRDGEDALSRGLEIIRDSYGSAGLDAQMIDGFGKLCQRYNGALNIDETIHALSRIHGGLNGLLNQAETRRKTMAAGKADAIAATAVDIINHVAPRGKKLQSWLKPPEKQTAAKSTGGKSV